MEDSLGETAGKMGYGVLRYSPNAVVAVIDSHHAGKHVSDVVTTARDAPVVRSIQEAHALGATAMVLGIAPPGGLIPPAWYPMLDEAIGLGMKLVNGLHDQLTPRYPQTPDLIWDVRVEPTGLGVGTGRAATLPNRRVLFIGTDMAIGKMTAGLEIWRVAREQGINAAFIATGQIGITVTGSGVPLDAVRVDFASGAIEREVMANAAAELILVEGQGALIHPGSTANLPLLRGSCPTHLILCHRANQKGLYRYPEIQIPPLREYIDLYESLATACGTFPRPKTVAIALNTAHVDATEARASAKRYEDETGLPVIDPVRDGAEALVAAVMA